MSSEPATSDTHAEEVARLTFSWLVEHALHGALHSISSALAVLSAESRGQTLTSSQRALVDSASVGAARIIRMSDDILLLTHLAAHTLRVWARPVAVDLLVREAITQAQSPEPPDPPREIQIRIPRTIPELDCDRELTRRALAALIENALRFSPSDTPVIVEAHKRRNRLIFRVRDSGAGVPASEAARIFEPLVSGERRHADVGVGLGIGLGLAVARVCAEAQHGSLTLESRAGPGASFALELPLAPVTAPA